MQVDSWGPIFAACLDDDGDVHNLFEALQAANLNIHDNDRGMDLYLRDDAPKRLAYNSGLSDRICPIIGEARLALKMLSRENASI